MRSRSLYRCSVVIPAYNSSSWIQRALGSVACQKGVDVEVIVIDDGSTDGTADVVRRVCPDAILKQTANHGVSAARNQGFHLSRGDFIQFLDDDDELAPDKLARQAVALANSGSDVAYGDWVRMEPRGSVHVPGPTVTRTLTSPEIELFTDFWSPPAAYLFTREVVQRVGGFSDHLPIIQDARFVLDCALLGARFEYCPGVAARYTVRTDSLGNRDPVAFARDVFRNALEVEQWWRDHGGLDEQRKDALLRVLSYVARSSFPIDRVLFDDAYEALMRVEPGYLPRHPRYLRLASRALGYRRAEQVALWYRQGRSRMLGKQLRWLRRGVGGI